MSAIEGLLRPDSGSVVIGGIDSTPSLLGLDDALIDEDTAPLSKRILIGAGAVLLLSLLMLFLGGYALGLSFGHVYVFFFFLIEFAVFLGLLAIAAWVVATVWKGVMRRG